MNSDGTVSPGRLNRTRHFHGAQSSYFTIYTYTYVGISHNTPHLQLKKTFGSKTRNIPLLSIYQQLCIAHQVKFWYRINPTMSLYSITHNITGEITLLQQCSQT